MISCLLKLTFTLGFRQLAKAHRSNLSPSWSPALPCAAGIGIGSRVHSLRTGRSRQLMFVLGSGCSCIQVSFSQVLHVEIGVLSSR